MRWSAMSIWATPARDVVIDFASCALSPAASLRRHLFCFVQFVVRVSCRQQANAAETRRSVERFFVIVKVNYYAKEACDSRSRLVTCLVARCNDKAGITHVCATGKNFSRAKDGVAALRPTPSIAAMRRANEDSNRRVRRRL
jgi:hypothetical protein